MQINLASLAIVTPFTSYNVNSLYPQDVSSAITPVMARCLKKKNQKQEFVLFKLSENAWLIMLYCDDEMKNFAVKSVLKEIIFQHIHFQVTTFTV